MIRSCVLSHLIMSISSWAHELQPTRLLCPWDFPGKHTGVGAISSSRGSSQPRDWTCVSCIFCKGRLGFFTTSATWLDRKWRSNIQAWGNHAGRETKSQQGWVTECRWEGRDQEEQPGSQVVRSLQVQAKEAGLYFIVCNRAKDGPIRLCFRKLTVQAAWRTN